MNKQITAVETSLALQENFIGPPTEPVAADRDVPVPKPRRSRAIVLEQGGKRA